MEIKDGGGGVSPRARKTKIERERERESENICECEYEGTEYWPSDKQAADEADQAERSR
jgi:hypothetical protein